MQQNSNTEQNCIDGTGDAADSRLTEFLGLPGQDTEGTKGFSEDGSGEFTVLAFKRDSLPHVGGGGAQATEEDITAVAPKCDSLSNDVWGGTKTTDAGITAWAAKYDAQQSNVIRGSNEVREEGFTEEH